MTATKAILISHIRGPSLVRKNLMLLWTAISTTPTVVNWLALAALAVLLLKVLWLNGIPEPFTHGYELGQLVENVLAAIIAAYVFFMISYQLPQILERRAVGPSMLTLMVRIYQHVLNILPIMNHYLHGRDNPVPQPVTFDVIKEMFARIGPNNRSFVNDSRGRWRTWFGYMVDEGASCIEAVDQVWRYARYIDAELAGLLDDVRLSQHAANISSMKEYRAAVIDDSTLNVTEFGDLSPFAWSYSQCYQAALALQAYCTRFREMYQITVADEVRRNLR